MHDPPTPRGLLPRGVLRFRPRKNIALRRNALNFRNMSEQPIVAEAAAEDDFYLMSNLFPADTGLPMVVWVSYRGHARHDARVKVCREHGDTIQHDNMASVAVRPEPRLVAGDLSAADLALVSQWITLNAEMIIDHWDGRISTVEVAKRLRRLPARRTPRPRA